MRCEIYYRAVLLYQDAWKVIGVRGAGPRFRSSHLQRLRTFVHISVGTILIFKNKKVFSVGEQMENEDRWEQNHLSFRIVKMKA